MAEPIRAGGAFVELGPKLAEGFADAAAKQLDPVTKSLGEKVSSAAGTVTKVLAGGVAGGAVALFAAGAKIDEALDTIRIGTGKTGQSLQDLDGAFRRVAGTVPNSFKDVADTITELNKRTGASGPQLDGLAQQLLTVSRITGTDLHANIAGVSKLIENFGVPVDKAGEKLDFLFKASQQSGVGFGDLAAQVTSAGPVMRQVGFSLEDTTSLIAQLSKEGVDSGPVMAGMKRALAELAKAGEDPQKTFNRLVTQIHDSKNPIEATQEAMKLFGTRGGAIMAEAIRNGRLNFDEFKKSIAGGHDTILGAATATDDAAETFGRLKNQILLAVEPLASKVFDTAAVVVGKLAGGVRDFLSGFTKGTGEIGSAQSKWAQWGAAVYEIFTRVRNFIIPLAHDVQQFFHALITGFSFDEGTGVERFALMLRDHLLPIIQGIVRFVRDNLTPVLAGLGAVVLAVVIPAFVSWAVAAIAAAAAQLAAIAPIILLGAAIAGLVGGVVWAYEHWTIFRETVDAVVSWITKTAWPALQAFAADLVVAWQTVASVADTVWHAIGDVISWFINGPVAFVKEQVQVLTDFLHQHWDEISAIVHFVWDALSTYFSIWWSVVSGVFRVAFDIISAWWGPFWIGLQAAVHLVFDEITTVLTVAWDIVSGIFRTARDVIATIFGALLDLLTGHWSRAWDTITSGIGKIFNDIAGTISKAFGDLLSGLGHLLDDLASWGLKLGKKIIEGIINAIESAAGDIGKAISGLIDKLPGGGVIKGALHAIGFASGTQHATGLAIVGERGPELVDFGNSGARVYSHPETQAILADASSRTYELHLGIVPGDPVDVQEQFHRMQLLSTP